MGRPPSRGAKPNQSEFRQNPQLADRTTKPQLSIQTISNACTHHNYNVHVQWTSFIVSISSKTRKNKICTVTHDYVTPHQTSKIYRRALKNSFFEPIDECTVRCVCTNFVRILIILDWWRQNAIDLWQNSAHLKAEATCLLKKTCGKIFRDRPTS